MSVSFKDYYSILGVEKSASADQIKKAFRDLARKYHPDLAGEAGKAAAEEKFKEINEAYEVLKNPETRAKYDQLGEHWREYGDIPTGRAGGREAGGFGDFGPGGGFEFRGGDEGYEYHFSGTGFSDFFERFFGGRGVDPFADEFGFGTRPRGRRRASTANAKGRDVEAELMVTLEEASRGASRRVTLMKVDPATGQERKHSIDVKIPAGVREGQRIRLAGQGQPSPVGGPPGDLFLKTRFAQHPDFKAKGSDLYYTLRVAPWELALGANLPVATLKGKVMVRVKSGMQSGQQLRLPGYGLAKKKGEFGDLIVELQARMPQEYTSEEQKLWRELQGKSRFNPRVS